jgi:hypothetical protein
MPTLKNCEQNTQVFILNNRTILYNEKDLADESDLFHCMTMVSRVDHRRVLMQDYSIIGDDTGLTNVPRWNRYGNKKRVEGLKKESKG